MPGDPGASARTPAPAVDAISEPWRPAPTSTRALKILDYPHFRIGYDEQAKNPAWVAYALSGPITVNGQEQRPSTFATDFHTAAHVAHRDYANSGFDRGHMCPAYAMFSRYGDVGMKETFIMSNVIPQYHGLNAGEWEQLEEAIAGRAGKDGGWAEKYGPLWIINGPLYERRPAPEKLPNGSWVPASCFSIVLRPIPSGWDALAFVMPNQKSVTGPISRYLTTIARIQAESDLDVLAGVPQKLREELEPKKTAVLWH